MSTGLIMLKPIIAQIIEGRVSVSLQEIQPTKPNRIMTLVEGAGIDVSDWSNFRGGERRAASNPKYCYEWSFVQPGKVVVLNLWHKELSEDGNIIFQKLNLRNRSNSYQVGDPRKRRASKMDSDIQLAYRSGLPIRVVVGAGTIRDASDPNAGASRMIRRLLDPLAWYIKSYDWNTGDCVLIRGPSSENFVDQFSSDSIEIADVKKVLSASEVFLRNPEVRRRVLLRAKGRCEFCFEEGFKTVDSAIFLETHHVVPLSEGGPDTEKNVVAICPNDHREAHFGLRRHEIRDRLLNYLASLS
jgi:5-methylcytosine-specific restriction protein A